MTLQTKRRESAIERKFVVACRRYGGTAVKLGHSGYPDQLVLWAGGVTTYAELKRPGEDPEPHQAEVIERMQNLGHLVQVIRCEADMVRFISASLGRSLAV